MKLSPQEQLNVIFSERARPVPIFEVIIGNPASPKHVYRIWADGKTEGFGDEDVNIRNRIPLALSAARGIAPVPT